MKGHKQKAGATSAISTTRKGVDCVLNVQHPPPRTPHQVSEDKRSNLRDLCSKSTLAILEAWLNL